MDKLEEYEIQEFISVGGESIVFKGVKRNVGRTYAMKFRLMEFQDEFENHEKQTFHALEQCSASKIAGVIENIPHQVQIDLYSKIPEKFQKNKNCLNLLKPVQFFCIIEDYIAGCNLKEYCEGAETKHISGHAPGKNATYESVNEFQKQLLDWTKQFCEIMMKITDQNKYLHLDIKPENIMILPETESLVIVDFGKAQYIGENGSISLHDFYHMPEVGIYGTPGYAAPECCDSVEFHKSLLYQNTGTADCRSDIFSFGATLWSCIYAHSNIRINHKTGEHGYFERDLFDTPEGYIPEVEEMIKKCTKKNPQERYQNYDELKKAAIYAEKRLALRDKPSKTLRYVAILTGLVAVLLIFCQIIIQRSKILTFEIAQQNFNEMSEKYSEHYLSEYRDTSMNLLQASPDRTESYESILAVSYQDDEEISKDEFDLVLLPSLDYTQNAEIKQNYLNAIMEKVKEKEIRSVSESIVLRDWGGDSTAFQYASAIANYMSAPTTAYDLLNAESEFPRVRGYLAKVLTYDSTLIKKIAEEKAITIEDVKANLEAIQKEVAYG